MKTNKRRLSLCLLTLLLALSLVWTPQASLHASSPPVNVNLDGETIQFTSLTGSPYIDSNNRTLVPFRVVLETFGAQVYWDNSQRMAVGMKNNTFVEVPVNQPYIFVNGELVPNDTQAVIGSDDRVYLPIRAVLEAFGAGVAWESGTRTVYIQSPIDSEDTLVPDDIPPEDPATEETSRELPESEEKQLQRLAETLEENITFIREPYLFTLFAFMNYTGYEEENNPDGFHPVRRSILRDLQRMNLELTDSRYYQRKRLPYSKYIIALAEMDSRFQYKNPEKVQALLPELADLDQRLQEFANQSDILRLYERYRNDYTEAIAMYRPEMYDFLARYTHFLRIPPRQVPSFSMLVNLQESYWRGYFLGDDYGPLNNGSIMVLGPSDFLNYRLLAHEYLHSIITPINRDLKEEIEELSHMMDQVPRGSLARNAVYNTWFTIFDESMVRALDSWFLDGNQEEIIRQETEAGFILTEYFYGRFKNDWENYNGTLEDFIRDMIQDLR